MKRALFLSALLLAACGKPEDDRDLKAAFAASALKDPSSVQLRNVQENDEVICGEYNSKNSYGAYSGFEPFVFQRQIKDLWLGESDNEYSRSAFWKHCPNAKELGLNDGALATTTDTSATDMNATDSDLNAVADQAENDALNAMNEADTMTGESSRAAEQREAYHGATGEYPQPDQGSDANNDAGE